jgi:hypothetical protein
LLLLAFEIYFSIMEVASRPPCLHQMPHVLLADAIRTWGRISHGNTQLYIHTLPTARDHGGFALDVAGVKALITGDGTTVAVTLHDDSKYLEI